jgi:hypothetical protein
VTATSYTTTAYSVCASDSANYAGGLNGQGIANVYDFNPGAYVYTNDASKEDCCNSCAANPLCVATAFYSGFVDGQKCTLNIITGTGQCTAGQYSVGASFGNTGVDQGYFISNGNCGRFDQSAPI